ncbi:tyrosine-type recombinase/integrase [Vibrio lentus]|uniref:tyrosine-type recombinase/integrase n=1 Tax=Vibrio lentus TaxID=136468 RepID=UPI000C83ABE0|nr:tyrosine-type recombinase/integrase [Vibrio lentus]MCB5460142.1 tyrosine-type recombinase/integrase [Vibrio lentus]MCC4849316.1 tyrosine-type recombinase/integrase [Vibrio lentus]MCC5493237.1 tyrosine-type recombinase/integrase [Vibrio lentus]MCC5530520.1 tyrosine-type recombinase/integrase [Vibrio lentus]MCC5537038.1 tyrosine-type recombinase/integrase [Vibrio lentus]
MKIINFSQVDLGNNIEIMKGINLHDDLWKIQYSQSEHILLNFERMFNRGSLADYKDLATLVKILTYYEFPKLINLSISSWQTTYCHFNGFANAAKHFFCERGFTSTGMFSNLTIEQCHDYIDECLQLIKNKVRGGHNRLTGALLFFDKWAELTERGLLPIDFRLEYDKYTIVSNEKRSEIFNLKEEVSDIWTPLEADIIKPVFDEASRYIRDFAPTIIHCSNLLRNRTRRGEAQALDTVREDGRTKGLYKTLLNIPVPELSDGVKIFNFVPTTKKVASKGYARGWQYRTTIDITEVRPALIKLKRCCIFIIGLFTGLRRREIAALKANATYQKNGSMYLDIVRFKTAADSDVEGQADSIPVPNIVANAIDVLIELFDDNRKNLDSEYLLVTDIITKKRYEKIKLSTVAKDIRYLVEEITGVDYAHPHQLRKSIAWLLISRSETNVDLIRQLFGHKSYGMTLRYIMRNELMVASVIELLEHNYTEDLKDIFEAISNSKTSGDLSDKIKKRMEEQQYKGQVLVTDIELYVRESLKAGVPLYVSRVPIGGFCMKSGKNDTLPPCMEKTGVSKPSVDFCDYKRCKHLIFNEESVANLYSQIRYYEQKLSYLDDCSNESIVAHYENEILEHKELLERLGEPTPVSDSREVTVAKV